MGWLFAAETLGLSIYCAMRLAAAAVLIPSKPAAHPCTKNPCKLLLAN